MVSLNERFDYLNRIQQIPKIKQFSDFLNGNYCAKSITRDDPCCIGFNDLIDSLSNNDEQMFKEFYNDYSRKKPSSDSLWINDDFLIFLLILGIVRYKIDRNWIKESIGVRVTQKPEYQSISKTFYNILENNFHSNDNLYEIVIVFQYLLNIPMSVEYFDDLYIRISRNNNLFSSKNEFLICLSIKAIDIIIISKELPNNTEIARMREFIKIFSEKVMIISKVICYIILSLVIVLIFVFWSNYKDIFNLVSIILSIVGVSFMVLLKKIQNIINKYLLFVFGYSKIFIKS